MLTVAFLLFGALLAQRFKVFALIPAIALVGLVTAAFSTRQSGIFWDVLASIALNVAVLQIGYLVGTACHYVLNAPQLFSVRPRSFGDSMSSRRTVN